MSENKTENNNSPKRVKRFTEDEVAELIRLALEKERNSVKTEPQTVIKMAEVEKVTLLYLGAIAKGTVVALGKIGKFTRSGNVLEVKKDDFLQSLGTQVVDALLAEKNLIVIDGLTDEERERYNLLYKEGELLSRDTYFKLFDLSFDQLCEVYGKLCETHKRIVAKMFAQAYFEEKDNRVNIDIVKALNKISKTVDKDGLFTPILDNMGKNIAEE